MKNPHAEVERVADAVLYEGYLLYPYRPSSVKNRQRWTFGGVFPRAHASAHGGAAAVVRAGGMPACGEVADARLTGLRPLPAPDRPHRGGLLGEWPAAGSRARPVPILAPGGAHGFHLAGGDRPPDRSSRRRSRTSARGAAPRPFALPAESHRSVPWSGRIAAAGALIRTSEAAGEVELSATGSARAWCASAPRPQPHPARRPPAS